MRSLLNTLAIITIMCLSLSSCQDKQTKEELAKYKQMEANKSANIEIVKQFYAHLDKFLKEEDYKAFIELWAPDSKRFGGSLEASMTLEEMTPFLKMYYTAFPDLKHHITNIVAENDYVVVQLKYTGTQEAEFMGISPSHKKIECKGVHIFKLTGGKVSELHFLDDDLTMFNQLGQQLK
jgi:predicted ester cyclase